ncbi:protein of unknown function [Modestobacter italicus]|uniref:Uncharacterized protein n=1 Tax=Modestobacter italicus (strain DSM 44449 / CECT 9708 / BC 501) TaxID=2732864 RepID=I4EWP8_MODI5|nr:protein of unknown function [Modestobacter marinus]
MTPSKVGGRSSMGKGGGGKMGRAASLLGSIVGVLLVVAGLIVGVEWWYITLGVIAILAFSISITVARRRGSQ